MPSLLRTRIGKVCCAALLSSLALAAQNGGEADRVRAWKEDLRAARDFADRDGSFTPALREEYRKQLAALEAGLDRKNDYQIIADLTRAVSLSGNGHTWVNVRRSTIPFSSFPLRLHWFRDGLFVVKAAPEWRDLVGCQVTHVAGLSAEELRAKTRALFHDTEQRSLGRSASFALMPEYMYGAGLIPAPQPVELGVRCGAGSRNVTLHSPQPLASARPEDGPWRLSPHLVSGQGGWTVALAAAGENVPRYLRHPEMNYWFEFLPDSGVLYFQFNRTLNAPEGESLRDFGQRLLRELDEVPVRALVVDMRFNGGGNLMIFRHVVEKLRSHPKLRGKNKLFVITSAATFSAAIFHSAQLRANPEAVFVGELVGDDLDFWAEGKSFTLPNSNLLLHYSDGYHNYSKSNPPNLRPYYMDLNIDTLEPDIPVRPSFTEYAAGRDVAMEEILKLVK